MHARLQAAVLDPIWAAEGQKKMTCSTSLEGQLLWSTRGNVFGQKSVSDGQVALCINLSALSVWMAELAYERLKTDMQCGRAATINQIIDRLKINRRLFW